MLIFPMWKGIPEGLLGKIVLFDMDETKKARGGVEIKPDEHYVNVAYSNDNHAPIFLGVVVNEYKGTLRVASTNTRLDSFLSEFVSKKNKLITEIDSLETELERKVDLKERAINDLDIEIDELNNQLKELQQRYKKRKKLVDAELRKNFYNWIDSNWFLRILYSLYENLS
ncbi:coiled-coil domain-containing protein [Streptococcus dysgalactiae]